MESWNVQGLKKVKTALENQRERVIGENVKAAS